MVTAGGMILKEIGSARVGEGLELNQQIFSFLGAKIWLIALEPH